MNVKQQQNSHPSSPVGETSTTTTNTSSELGYQLRALKENISALESNPWIQASTLSTKIQLSSLSNELVNETLNYFVNCGQRLSQMTKAYDDNEAYILLLQEKEVDLELAARIGQDLLNQNKQLKDSIKSLEEELAQRRDDVHQLKHELASKNSLLDTFIEEEEQQTSSTESEEELTVKQQQDHLLSAKPSTSTNNQTKIPVALSLHPPEIVDQRDATDGFFSLNLNHQRPPSTTVEAFSSLPYQMNSSSSSDSRQHLTNDDAISTISEGNLKSCNESNDHQVLVQTVTFQLVESNKRLCELQDEIFYKGEQNLMQQEKIYHLQDRLRELDQRLGDVASENEALHKSVTEAAETRRELSDELKVCKRNFSELLCVFLEMQKESRLYRMSSMQQNSNINFFGELDPVNDINNISFDSYSDTPLDIHNTTSSEAFNQNTALPLNSSCKMPNSSSLLEELQESMKKNGDDRSDSDLTDGGDSGVHINNISSHPVTPTADRHRESDCESTSQSNTRNKKSWLGFSSFMITTLLLICLSVTLSSSANFNLAQKLQFKLER